MKTLPILPEGFEGYSVPYERANALLECGIETIREAKNLLKQNRWMGGTGRLTRGLQELHESRKELWKNYEQQWRIAVGNRSATDGP